MKITVRKIAQGEELTASQIEKECLKTAWSEKQIASLPETAVYLVALCGETVCGIASMYCVFDEGQIMNIAVLPDYRKQGIASQLLDELLRVAAEKHCEILTLDVAENNFSALALYKKQGFCEIGRRKRFYGDCDAILMEKTICSEK